ncbi:MAG: hypothetical protein M3362_26725, partial [Acidobacteriota bacterium]|nr:hypothetical protein [Acidobacteriota bacterium]
MNGLSTTDGANPLKILEQFNSAPVILVAVAIWTRHSQTGMLIEKGVWIKNFWSRILNRITDVQGCQLLWNTLFFAVPSGDVLSLKDLFREELTVLYDPLLESFCIIAEAHGTPSEKLLLLDEMQG